MIRKTRLQPPVRDQALPFSFKCHKTSPAWIWKEGKTSTQPAGDQRGKRPVAPPPHLTAPNSYWNLCHWRKDTDQVPAPRSYFSRELDLGARLLPRNKRLEKTTSLKQFNTGQKRHILICTAMHLGYKFTQHNWKKIQTMLLYLFHGVSLIPSHLPFSASLNAAIYTHKQTITSWMFI